MKSSGDIQRGSFSAWDGGRHDPMTFKRNLQSLAVLLLILGRSACLFFGQMRVHHATLLPEVPKVRIHVPIPDFNWQSIEACHAAVHINIRFFPKKECRSELGKKRKTISILLKGPNKFKYIPVKKSKLL
jgi:hypothetical protein